MKNRQLFQTMALVTTISSYLVGPTLLGIFWGMWIDNKVATKPLFLLIGLFIGMFVGIYGTYRIIKEFESGE